MGLKPDKIQRSLVFNKEEYEELQEIAARKDKSLSNLLREMIRDYVKANRENN